MKKIIRLTESQMAKLTEVRINEVTAAEVAKVLETIPCTGQSVKSLISKKLLEYGFKDVTVKFLNYGESNKLLNYIVHTEGPIFVVETISNSKVSPPCMEVLSVIPYLRT
tara:strand:+ start:945 stop:1274 length:330 start_codon:yes stop_codon:yes gene_type:complete